MSKPTIMKFGGTSVKDTDAFQRVVEVVLAQSGNKPVVVVSAISGVTNALLASVELASNGQAAIALGSLDEHFVRHRQICRDLLDPKAGQRFDETLLKAREQIGELLAAIARNAQSLPILQDAVVAFGEQLSASLLAEVMRANGLRAQYIDARRCIVTDEEHGRANPRSSDTDRSTRSQLEPVIARQEVPVLGGFIAASIGGATTTLGRGGSDYSAAILGAALGAREIQIWTDVTGVLTADPRVVKTARTIPRLSYSEAAELAYFGAKVLHPKTIQPAVEHSIPVRICNSREPDEAGTLVVAESQSAPETVKAIAHKTNVTTVQITSARMLGAYGFLRAIFEIFEKHRTVVDVVTTSEVSVSLSLDDTSALAAIVDELRTIGTVSIEKDRAIICVVGEGLRNTAGIAGKIFDTLSDINISLISQGASSINLTFAVDQYQAVEAVSRLHETFFGQFATVGENHYSTTRSDI